MPQHSHLHRPGPATLLGVLALAAGATSAADRRQADKHQHGVSELRVAMDGNDVELEFEGPAANFIGFEHAPKTPAQQQAVSEAVASLKAPAQLFGWPAVAGCRLTASEVTPPAFSAGHDGEHDAEHDADHEEGHDSDHEGDNDRHSEFAAVYSWRCTQPAALDALRVLVFTRFPGTERIEASVVGPKGQRAATLSRSAALLRLTP